jgi:hypothetical protein
MRKTRGESRLCSVTYTQLSEWTLFSIGTLRNLQHKGLIDVRDLPSILAWVNARRARLGLPLIGQPDAEPQRTLEEPNPTTATYHTPELPYSPSTAAYTYPGCLHYNPNTGEYDE